MTQRRIIAENEEDTADFAVECANAARADDIFLLCGPMGAGKSSFARTFIRHLAGAAVDVPSPTFTLVQTYETPHAEIWHFDLYRLETPEEIYELGWEEAIGRAILLIEWPERLGALRPASYTEITLKPLEDDKREIEVRHVA